MTVTSSIFPKLTHDDLLSAVHVSFECWKKSCHWMVSHFVATSDLPPLNCFIHLPTTAAVMTFIPCTHFNCSWISTGLHPVPIKNLITPRTSHAKYSFTGTSTFAHAYLAFYWNIRPEILTACVETSKLNFPRVWLHFINTGSLTLRAILTFQMILLCSNKFCYAVCWELWGSLDEA